MWTLSSTFAYFTVQLTVGLLLRLTDWFICCFIGWFVDRVINWSLY